jgi:ADP-dependent NAD(P)H-hydrate dehydratase / NAD(P)H-hydrate epimerase
MLPILTPTESAALDRASAEKGVSVGSLMEAAGWAVARATAALAGGAYGRRAVVVCGKGNNGGDALVAARYLERWGMGVSAVLLAPPGGLRDAAAANFHRYAGAGGRWRRFSSGVLIRELGRADVVLDGIIGTGFRGSPEDDVARAIELINGSDADVVAVDIPSGVEGETGAVRGSAVRATCTVTFGSLKPGIVFYPGAGYAGEVQVADIGFPAELIRSDLWLVERHDAAALLPPRAPESHKRASGAVLVVAGSRAMTGAAVLTASSAYRAGAGLVTLAVPEGILPVVESAITETTFLPLPQTDAGSLSAEAWPQLRERLESVDAAAVGPGLSTDPGTVELVRRLVAESPIPFVLDADGLGAFAGGGADVAERRSEAVLTPHPGEFGRLTGLSSKQVLEDRIGHARKAAAEFRCPVLLKGSRTVIARPDGTAFVNPTGGPYLATGGTGDVLTGAIGAFLARHLQPADAAILGAYAHGLAGRMAASVFGEGTVASDVSSQLPRALVSLSPEEL